MEDIDVVVTAKKSSKGALQLKELVHRVAPGIIREQLAIYIKSMREGRAMCFCFLSCYHVYA